MWINLGKGGVAGLQKIWSKDVLWLKKTSILTNSVNIVCGVNIQGEGGVICQFSLHIKS